MLRQRNHRWGNFDPAGRFASIYSPNSMARLPDGSAARNGVTSRSDRWHHVGKFFVTGPYVGLDNGCSVERQIAWLEEHRPTYLLSMSSNLEHLALGFQDRGRPDDLRGLRAAAQQLTPAMRRTIEGIFQVPVQQSYGFNEIGIVATECLEGRRFHVHTENCLVEIVGADGKPSPAGEFGRLLVTSLSNTAMPLLRYAPDDLAMAVDGPCPCGRTLPSFAAIQGRYSRIAFLPPGVWRHWIAIDQAVKDMPFELLQPLRQYQVHHHRDGRFTVRMVLAGPLSPEFRDRIDSNWAEANREHVFPLEFVEVPEIPRESGVKITNFTSDLVPPPDWEPDDAHLDREALQ
jgi:phenylacetate-CoA ligase